MKKRLLTAALVALLPLSLAACGGQSKQAACQIINDKAVKAIDGLDPSNTEDMIQGMTNVATVLKSDDITNTEVKAAAVAAGDSAQALADFAKTVGDDPSADQMSEAMDLYTTFTTSMSSLETVCTARGRAPPDGVGPGVGIEMCGWPRGATLTSTLTGVVCSPERHLPSHTD